MNHPQLHRRLLSGGGINLLAAIGQGALDKVKALTGRDDWQLSEDGTKCVLDMGNEEKAKAFRSAAHNSLGHPDDDTGLFKCEEHTGLISVNIPANKWPSVAHLEKACKTEGYQDKLQNAFGDPEGFIQQSYSAPSAPSQPIRTSLPEGYQLDQQGSLRGPDGQLLTPEQIEQVLRQMEVQRAVQQRGFGFDLVLEGAAGGMWGGSYSPASGYQREAPGGSQPSYRSFENPAPGTSHTRENVPLSVHDEETGKLLGTWPGNLVVSADESGKISARGELAPHHYAAMQAAKKALHPEMGEEKATPALDQPAQEAIPSGFTQTSTGGQDFSYSTPVPKASAANQRPTASAAPPANDKMAAAMAQVNNANLSGPVPQFNGDACTSTLGGPANLSYSAAPSSGKSAVGMGGRS